jgi:Fe-S cluster assembly iron-binding protein IscA
VLSITTTANEAIEGILASAEIPEEAGVRIEAAAGRGDNQGAAEFQLMVAPEPQPGDEVLADGDLFVEQGTAELLDESELDAEIEDGQVRFRLQAKQA